MARVPLEVKEGVLSISQMVGSLTGGCEWWCGDASPWMPGRLPWKVDCMFGSAAGGVAVVMASLHGRVDGVEPGGGGSW